MTDSILQHAEFRIMADAVLASVGDIASRYGLASLDRLLASYISLEDLANIAVRMSMHNVSEGQVISRQGERGDHMYFISHGVVRIAREELGDSRDLATLMAGDFFGEATLLSGEPRNATVTAVTDCTLYKLHRDDLEVAMSTQPAIRKALEEESRKRSEMHFAG